MIYTLTLNPALDRTLIVENLSFEDTNKVSQELRYAGGKGIDVSRVINELGGESIALGFVGGYDGMELEGRLINEGITCDFTKIVEETRINIFIKNEKGGERTSLHAKGPEISPSELAILYNKIKEIHPTPSWFVMSGSLPLGISNNIYAQLTRLMKTRGAKVFLDSDGRPFKKGIEALPHAIKPNIFEIERLRGKPFKTTKALITFGKKLLSKGIPFIMISLGEKGILFLSEKENLQAIPPKVTVRSTVGAGDSSVAGFIFAYERGESIRNCLKMAVACGTATVLTPGTALCRKKDVERILKKCEVTRIHL
ncbi:MAG: 1-phosphofructokinase [Candidatus Cloacimonadota bacterium]|nr:MAG: 1-phosphofructokinase [Candidatus Cloacimonadota bacterium]